LVQEAGREKTDPDGSPEPGPPESRSPDSGRSFDQRLSAARTRRGLDAEPASADSVIDQSSLGLVMRVGVELVSAVIVGLAIGWGLDAWLKNPAPLHDLVRVPGRCCGNRQCLATGGTGLRGIRSGNDEAARL